MLVDNRLMVGKYKGEFISSPDVPLTYLDWVRLNWALSKSQRKMIEEEIKRRRQPYNEGRIIRKARNA